MSEKYYPRGKVLIYEPWMVPLFLMTYNSKATVYFYEEKKNCLERLKRAALGLSRLKKRVILHTKVEKSNSRRSQSNPSSCGETRARHPRIYRVVHIHRRTWRGGRTEHQLSRHVSDTCGSRGRADEWIVHSDVSSCVPMYEDRLPAGFVADFCGLLVNWK